MDNRVRLGGKLCAVDVAGRMEALAPRPCKLADVDPGSLDLQVLIELTPAISLVFASQHCQGGWVFTVIRGVVVDFFLQGGDFDLRLHDSGGLEILNTPGYDDHGKRGQQGHDKEHLDDREG